MSHLQTLNPNYGTYALNPLEVFLTAPAGNQVSNPAFTDVGVL